MPMAITRVGFKERQRDALGVGNLTYAGLLRRVKKDVRPEDVEGREREREHVKDVTTVEICSFIER